MAEVLTRAKLCTESVTTTLVKVLAAREFQSARWLMMTLTIINPRLVLSSPKQIGGFSIEPNFNTITSLNQRNSSWASAKKISLTNNVISLLKLTKRTIELTAQRFVVSTNKFFPTNPRCLGKKSRIWFKFSGSASPSLKARNSKLRL